MNKIYFSLAIAGVLAISSCGGRMSDEELQNTINELNSELENWKTAMSKLTF